MKTKNFLFSLLLVGTAGVMSAQAQKPKPKLAVLVVGMGSAAKSDDFAARLGSDLNRDGEYTLQTKDNNTAVADKLTTLRAQTTPVDATGLAAWGKANGIDFVQLVVQGPDYGGMRTSRVAQLVSCSTGELSERGTYRMYFTPKGVDVNAVIELVPVAGGVFEMGYKSGRDGSSISDAPLHWVKVNDFHIGKFTITQAQWKHVMGWLPGSITSTYRGDRKPVIYVSYDEIVHSDTGFLAKLNKLTGKNYRLPTEAEWEYAARGCDAGVCESKQYSGSTIIGDVAYYSRSSGGPITVGTLSANALGIHDMSGNVWEWCYDWYDTYASSSESSPLDNPTGPTTPGSSRVLRGGSWFDDMYRSRVAIRSYGAPSSRNYLFGFRVVLP